MQPAWRWSKECTDVKGAQTRGLCQKYQGLTSELASAEQAELLGKRIDEVRGKITNTEGGGTYGAAMSEADPQAAVLSKLLTFVGAGTVKVEDMQTALTIFVALLLEVGSGFGMYVAFSTWRLHDRSAPQAPKLEPVALAVATPPVARATPRAAPVPAPAPVAIANDNRDEPVRKLVAPESDVERFYKDRIEAADGSSLTATVLYEDYIAWCEDLDREPLALPTFGREFGELGIQKAKIAGRVRYIGVALKSVTVPDDEKRPTVTEPGNAAQAA
jgi:hypothetical protein